MAIKPVLLFFLAAVALATVCRVHPFHPVESATLAPTREQLTGMYPGVFYYRGPREAKKVALTFDDGPDDRITPLILDILKENSVPGTFFLIGQNALQYPDIVRRIAVEGHIIGNHTWSHPNLLEVSPARTREEIRKTTDLLERITGRRAALLRPPRGRVSAAVINLARKEGLRVIAWSVDSFDWKDPGSARVTARLRREIHPGAIILMHAFEFPASKGVTIKVLPGLIKDLQAQGYQLVTVDNLLQIPAYGPPRPADNSSRPGLPAPGDHVAATG